MENYYSLAAAALKLGVSAEAVRRLYGRGTMGGVRFAGRIFVLRVDVDERGRERKSLKARARR